MYTLPKSLEAELKQPLGRLVDEPTLLQLLAKEQHIISIGDRVTFTVLSHGIRPSICIVDFILERNPYAPEMRKLISSYGKTIVQVRNPPGTISDELWTALEALFSHPERYPVRVEVQGEEDLAALAAIALAPGGATIIYGLPNRGVVVVTATPENKKTVNGVLQRMK
jgi:GTP-dependent dephospho-CoA kinase